MSEGKIALIDMDGTLFDYEGQLRKDLAALMSPEEKMPDDLWDESLTWIKERMNLIKRVPGWWRNLPKFQLGWDVYEEIDEIGFCCQILTKGPLSKSRAWMEKVDCIQDHFGDDVIPNIVGESKGGSYGRVLVDDYVPYVEDWLKYRSRGLVIMPAHDYNKDFRHENVIRYDGSNLLEVSHALQAAYDRKPEQHWKEIYGNT